MEEKRKINLKKKRKNRVCAKKIFLILFEFKKRIIIIILVNLWYFENKKVCDLYFSSELKSKIKKKYQKENRNIEII